MLVAWIKQQKTPTKRQVNSSADTFFWMTRYDDEIKENLRSFPAIDLALDPEWEEGQEGESHDDRGLGTPFCVKVVGNRS